jgi:hypothetical protein
MKKLLLTTGVIMLLAMLPPRLSLAGKIVNSITEAPNNDDYSGPFFDNPNFTSVLGFGPFGSDNLNVVQPSGGTTEYAFSISGEFASNPAATIQYELGFGVGEHFVSAELAFPDLDFDAPLPGTPPTSEVFAAVNHQPHRIEFSDGVARAYEFDVARISFDVPDLPASVNDYYTTDDLAEYFPDGIPAGAAVFTMRSLVTQAAPPLIPALAPQFAADYSLSGLGTVAGVSTSGAYGGLAIRPSDPQTLLIAGNANEEIGALYAANVIRDAGNHIVGFDGTATRAVGAPLIDGGAQSGPGDVLFLTRYYFDRDPNNELGQSKPGSQGTDKVVSLEALGVAVSPSALSFVPPGLPGAGQLKVVTYETGDWYTLDLAPDGNGTFNITAARNEINLSGGPRGIAYVPPGSPIFGETPTVLISEYDEGAISAYDLDVNGDPIPETRREFLTGIVDGAWGGLIDPLSGDLLFTSTPFEFGLFPLDGKVFAVRGFVAPKPIPEPSNPLLLLSACLLLACRRRHAT